MRAPRGHLFSRVRSAVIQFLNFSQVLFSGDVSRVCVSQAGRVARLVRLQRVSDARKLGHVVTQAVFRLIGEMAQAEVGLATLFGGPGVAVFFCSFTLSSCNWKGTRYRGGSNAPELSSVRCVACELSRHRRVAAGGNWSGEALCDEPRLVSSFWTVGWSERVHHQLALFSNSLSTPPFCTSPWACCPIPRAAQGVSQLAPKISRMRPEIDDRVSSRPAHASDKGAEGSRQHTTGRL